MNHLSMCSFAQYMISQSNFLAARYVDLSYWLDPESPMPFVLIADFGHKIAQEFESIGEKDWSELVSLIEEGLNSEDEYIETAVATGLIEAIVHVAEPIHGLWPRIDSALGPEARAYAEA